METPQVVAARVERVLAVIGSDRLVVAPDCGMKYLPRERALRKLEAMVAGAELAVTCLIRSVGSAASSPTGSKYAAVTCRAS